MQSTTQLPESGIQAMENRARMPTPSLSNEDQAREQMIAARREQQRISLLRKLGSR